MNGNPRHWARTPNRGDLMDRVCTVESCAVRGAVPSGPGTIRIAMSATPILKRAVVRSPLCPVHLAKDRGIDSLTQKGDGVVEAFFPKHFAGGSEFWFEGLVDGHVFVVAWHRIASRPGRAE